MSKSFLTLLIVPHDERSVRRLRLSTRSIQVLGAAALLVGSLSLAGFLTWERTAARAARAQLLEQENRRLLSENAKVSEIAANLERSEQAYREIRALAVLEQGSDLSPAPWVDDRSSRRSEESPRRDPVVATAAGTVVKTGRDSVHGRFIVLARAGETVTVYVGNGRLLVGPGDRVARGEIVAYGGDPGPAVETIPARGADPRRR